MSILTLFNKNGIEIVVNTRTGEAFTTQNGYTKLSDKPKQTIGTRLSQLALTGKVRKDEVATVFGVKTFKLIPAKLTLDWLQIDRPDLAAEVSDPTAYLYQIAGYTHPVKAKRQRKAKAVEGARKSTTKTAKSLIQQGLESARVSEQTTGLLKRFESTDGVELLINTRTGEAFATQAGYARMSGIGTSGIGKRTAKLISLNTIKTAEIDTGYGLKVVSLIPADLVYDWMFSDNPPLAKAMGKAGATVYMHQIAGFKITSDAIAKPAPAPAPTEPEQTKLGSTIEQTAIALMPLRLLMPSVPDALVDGFLLNRLQAHHPELKPDIEAAHTLLAATNPVSGILLTPTAIGERLGISAKAVNTLLINGGYQIKNLSKSKTEPAYISTEKGKKYSTNTLATGRGSDNTTYQHIKWNESIIDELQQ